MARNVTVVGHASRLFPSGSGLQRPGADPRHGLGDHQRFGKCQEPHWARRSRIS